MLKILEANIWCIKSDKQLQKYLAQYNMYLIDNSELTTESLFVLGIEIGTGKKIYWDLEDFIYVNNDCKKVEGSFDEKSVQFINDRLVVTAKENLKDSFLKYEH